jgi:undecaprenyl-diphosphatase
MLEWLVQIDRAVFVFINSSIANIVTDFAMPIITSDNLLRILYGLAMLLLIIKGNRRMRFMVIGSVVVLVITDQLSSGLLKPLIDRARPCHDGQMETLHLLVNCGGGKAMPSSHAANAFGQALYFLLFFPRLRIALLSFASMVAISRVFVGVHYPADIIVGALIGLAVGILIAYSFTQLEARWTSDASRT